MPSLRARAARMNGLIDEPGWRWPLVARLKGRCVEVRAADHRLDLAGLVLDRDERARSARCRRARPEIACSAARWSVGSIVVRDLQPAAEDAPGAVAVDELLGHPAREVGLRRSRVAAASTSLATGHGLRIAVAVLRWRDHPLRRASAAAPGCVAAVALAGFCTGSYASARRSSPASRAASRRASRRAVESALRLPGDVPPVGAPSPK